MPKNVVADTGYWFALFKQDDDHHDRALEIEKDIEHLNILIPWPTLYETINTKFVKKAEYRQGLQRYLDKGLKPLLKRRI